MNKREEILTLANQAVNGERQNTYGSPEQSFQRIAYLWTAYLDRFHIPLTELDVAKMMILFKIARTQENREHPDNWVDIAGYAACAGEIEYGHFHLGAGEKQRQKEEYYQKSFDKALEEVKKAVGRQVTEGEF